MNRRQELCRNFQRGSCKYGAQCRFVHASSNQQQQQAAKPNPFGFGTSSRQQQPFGTQSQQQPQPNPFGFGVQAGAAQSRNAPGPAKPFQNKWVRDASAPTKQPEAQPAPQAAHTSCTDPESCKQQISDDFKNETPLWKLTCYAHLRSGPCDIVGDVSYEELRAKAYEEGKRGHPLQSIIEGERNLQNAKLMEFTNLLNNARPSQTPSFPTVGSFPAVKNTSSFGGSQTNGPPVFSSFSQIGAATNFGSGLRTATPGVPTNALFGQSTQPAFGQSTQPAFGQSTQPTFGQSAQSTFGSGGMKFGVPDASQTSRQPFGTLQGSSMSSNSNFPKSPSSSVHQRDIDRQSMELLNGMTARTSAMNQAPVEDNRNENKDDSIWLKEKWAIGEIPLDEPPQRHISHVF
ncbi:zinc finger CCCH domain-containing protein 46 [Brachypodium distachyon]|uniref:C3H1-type domain-containing protein n=1 Tax=Brachypodium distachyon TaxID=15368 RepID=I1GWT0_BRADI|nr:zinc finger CCCH domain-containing protein 46 [Brachypodium distachyon]KQK17442.1 hypothetical protein BRADI_1g34507v3 [Brachypodium distachyon]|eukprot:XP_010227435.1 zinc finger CCCH domain-containing protein 46 [Brachypodium distachyon]